MWDFLCRPLAYTFSWPLVENPLAVSFLLSSLWQLPLWLYMGLQDYKTTWVPGWSCAVTLALTLVNAVLFGTPLSILCVIVCIFLTFGPTEFKLFGDADFAMLGHWFTSYFVYETGSSMMIAASLLFLIAIFIYIAIYRDENGGKWHPGKMVPILPPYAIAVLLTTSVRYPLSRMLFELGW